MSAHRGLRCLSAGSRERIGDSTGAVWPSDGGGLVTARERSGVKPDLERLAEAFFYQLQSIFKDLIIGLKNTKISASILRFRNSQTSRTST
jgi:hypothetical protein